jgi:hypothetical protein
MEFFSGHDINGDGKNDIYIRHKGQGDPLVVLFMFALIALVIGFSYGSFTLFCYFLSDPKDFPNSVMIMSFAGSFVVVGIFVGWLCGQLGRSYSVPFGALGLFFTIGFLWVGISDMEPAAKKKEADAAAFKSEQEYLKFRQRTEPIESRIKPIQEKLIAAAQSRGWNIVKENSNFYIQETQPKDNPKDNYSCWIQWPQGSGPPSYSVTAFAPIPDDNLKITINDNNKGLSNDELVSMYRNPKPREITIPREPYNFMDDYLNIFNTPFKELKPGKLKDLANELAGYLYSLKVATEKVSKEIDLENAEVLATQQQEAKDRDNERRGWVVVCVVATGSILAIFGLVFFLKRKNKLTTIPPTPAPPQDKPAISTVQRYKYTCSGCSARYKLTQDALGKSFPCKKCKITCWVPMDVDQLSIE